MNNLLKLSLLCLVLLAGAWSVLAGDTIEVYFQVYVGTYNKSKDTQVIISVPEGRLTTAMGIRLAEELQKTFQLDELKLISEPKVMVQIGRKATIQQGYQGESGQSGFGIKLSTTVKAVEGNVAQVQCEFSYNDKDQPGSEFFTQMGQPVTLACRMDGEIIFIIGTFIWPAAEPQPGSSGTWNWPLGFENISPIGPPGWQKKLDLPRILLGKTIDNPIQLEFEVRADGVAQKFHLLKGGPQEVADWMIEQIKNTAWKPAREKGVPITRTIVLSVCYGEKGSISEAHSSPKMPAGNKDSK